MTKVTEKNGNGKIVTVEMTFKKDTPGTFVYANEDENTPIPTLYIRKGAFKGSAHPETITVTVT